MNALVTATATGTGLLAGLFLSFSTAVMPALRRRPAPEAAAAMQAVNRAIQNPVFLVVFVGTAGLAAVTAVLAALDGDWRVLTGSALAIVGAHLITGAVNIPLNNALDRAPADHAAWEAFAGPWSRANTVRALVTTAATVLLAS